MSSGVARMATGAVTGTGALINVRTLDFRPRKVELLNTGGLVTAVWKEGMADDSMVKRVTDGTMTVPTSDGIIPLSDGFSIGADADVNATGELVEWVAHE